MIVYAIAGAIVTRMMGFDAGNSVREAVICLFFTTMAVHVGHLLGRTEP